MADLLSERTKDRLATGLIRVGGIVVILVVVGIVLNIGWQAAPLFFGAGQGPVQTLDAAPGVLAAGSDSRREVTWVLESDGHLRFLPAGSFEPVEVSGGEAVLAADHEIHGLVSLITGSGHLEVGEVRFLDRWIDGERMTVARWRPSAEPLAVDPVVPWAGVTANADSDGTILAAWWTLAGGVSLASWDPDDELWSPVRQLSVTGVRDVAVAEGLRYLAVVDGQGRVQIRSLPGGAGLETADLPSDVTTARYLIGGGSLITGSQDGRLAVTLVVPRVEVSNDGQRPITVAGVKIAPGSRAVVPDDQIGQAFASEPEITVAGVPPVCRVVRELPPLGAGPRFIAPSHRDRSFLVGGDDGTIGLYHSTSGRRLLLDRWTDGPVETLALDPKTDGAVARIGDTLVRRTIRNPHPETSLGTLFLPVWYEGYAKPKWVWQSTGGTDAFEPKLSLWPLIFGTLKATLYAMVLSIPLALFAAIYVSRLAPPWLQTTVKPTLELMAAVPSVVVGFLAALWLAPRLEQALLASFVAVLLLPAAIGIALVVWRAVPAEIRRRAPEGAELGVLAMGVLVLVVAVPPIAGWIETWLFGGDFQRWLFTDLGIRYDQRNSLVVGLGLGFAVIPVIFTIAEDACSAVPDALVNASRALGATKWQTAVRLVVPAASPGLFAAVMLGLGRAVGETMIVLMAAGNTPLLDLSPFNGMRTMSAAIAVEIPEAPVGGTLFRVLFLTGTLLFVFTLVLTTAADLVGSYLRKRYARF